MENYAGGQNPRLEPPARTRNLYPRISQIDADQEGAEPTIAGGSNLCEILQLIRPLICKCLNLRNLRNLWIMSLCILRDRPVPIDLDNLAGGARKSA